MMTGRANSGRAMKPLKTADDPVDVNHLNRYTGGDASLNREILQLFDTQCREMVVKLEELAGQGDLAGKAWKELTHSLKGAARGVGAFGLADVAAEAEKLTNDRLAAIEAVHRLKSKSCAVQLFIDHLLKHEP